MASHGSYIRSAAQVTYSAYRSVPIRWRLAGGSAALTFVILASFAVLVGALTNRQVRTQFDTQLGATATTVAHRLNNKLTFRGTQLKLDFDGTYLNCDSDLDAYAIPENAEIRLFNSTDDARLCAFPGGAARASHQPLLDTLSSSAPAPFDASGYRAVVRTGVHVKPFGTVTLLYAQPLSDVDKTLARVQVFLLLGVLGGTVLALLAGLFVSDRATAPITELTQAAREIARTRDPRRRIPHPEAEDEIAELARTLEEMLGSLEASRSNTQAMLDRQREFIADASHELRTPLTSVLANLELLTEELDGQPAETAEAALRSTRRMRRLVGDLLLLARADADRGRPHRRTDLGQVLVEAAAELGPLAQSHPLEVRSTFAPVLGVPDELHRLILNLLENAMRHTPSGTAVRATADVSEGRARLAIEDDGPGIPPELADRVFERFVRGGRDGGRGSGLGLAIVHSVAESHGGSVTLTSSTSEASSGLSGSRFLVLLPLADVPDSPEDVILPEEHAPTAGADPSGAMVAAQTSTTTGRTIGRRRSRS